MMNDFLSGSKSRSVFKISSVIGLSFVIALPLLAAPASKTAAPAKSTATPTPKPAATPKPTATPDAAKPVGNPVKNVAAETPKPAPVSTQAEKPLAAEVNGDKIYKADLDRQVNSMRDRIPALRTGSDQANATLSQMRKERLDSLIEYRLLYQEAKRRKINPPKTEIDKRISTMKSDYPNEAAFKKDLAQAGKTEADIRQKITEELAIQELNKQIVADTIVPEADVTKFYNDNKKDFTLPERVAAHHILVGFPQEKDDKGNIKFRTPTADEKAKALAKAKDVMKKVQANGSNMEQLAVEYSDDPTAKGWKDVPGNKGYLIPFNRSQMVKSFSDAVFAAEEGKVIGPIETEYGFHIARVDRKVAEQVIPLSTVKDQIEAMLLQQKVKERLDGTVAQLRQKAAIKIY